MSDEVEVRLHPGPSTVTLVFLPGLHGDWTLIAPFRRALNGRARFVELTYPRTSTWSLADYAAGVERALAAKEIRRGWLLAESFSSQIVWPLVEQSNFTAEGIIFAGGFGPHPARWAARLAGGITGIIPLSLIRALVAGYAQVARLRFRRAPETLAGIKEFVTRRTEADRQAAKHRLHLVAENDPCAMAERLAVPLYALSGLFDPVVPWLWARRWLKNHCPALREYRIITCADHNVLSTAPHTAAEQVLRWISEDRARLKFPP